MLYKRSKAFTLVELIIAITILGLLAVGLLAALDPAEQFAKGRDTSTSQIAQTMSGAIERYRASFNNSTPGTFPAGTAANNSIVANTANGLTIVNALITAGELKSNFTSAAGAELAKIVIMRDITATGSIFVCYKPTSKSFMMQPGQYFLASSAATPVGTNAITGIAQQAATTRPGSANPTNASYATLACASQATSTAARNYCIFCYQQ